MTSEWGGELIRSWNSRGWIDLPERVAAAIAPLIGARPDEVAVADSTSINLFKLLAAALARIRAYGHPVRAGELPHRPLHGAGVSSRLLGRAGVAACRGSSAARGGPRRRCRGPDADPGRLPQRRDASDLEALDRGGPRAWVRSLVWDLAHSAGALPVDLGALRRRPRGGLRLQVPERRTRRAVLRLVARRLHERLRSPLWGWMGHADALRLRPATVRPPAGAAFQVGTPPILSLAALECGVARVVAEIGVDRLRAKSIALTSNC